MPIHTRTNRPRPIAHLFGSTTGVGNIVCCYCGHSQEVITVDDIRRFWTHVGLDEEAAHNRYAAGLGNAARKTKSADGPEMTSCAEMARVKELWERETKRRGA